MADVIIQVVTEDCTNDEVYSHELTTKEERSDVDTLMEGVEAALLLYASKGIKSIHLYFNGED